MRNDGTKWVRERMLKGNTWNHLPIRILFIVCNFSVFKAKFMNASCVIVHQLMNGGSQCVHKMQYTIDFSLSRFTFTVCNTWVSGIAACFICVSRAGGRRRKKFSIWKIQQSSDLASKRKISVSFSVFNNAIVDRPTEHREPRREQYVMAHTQPMTVAEFFSFHFFPFCYFTWKHSREKYSSA